ncbi:MAG: hypothetical protein EXS16_18215 [Gemmataceae bacterium]|nr:hypothetical protein [Gemmataceae bacterium]
MNHPTSIEDSHVQIQKSIYGLYHVFGKYRLQPHVEGCPCCVSDADNAMLQRKRLRELTGDDLYKFAFKAMTTWGDADDFRHFLPRIVELQASDAPIQIDNEIVFGKLRYGEWRAWPQTEQDAVESFLKTWGKILLNSYPCHCYMTEYLCALALVTEDVIPFLNEWRGHLHSVPALRHLAYIAREYAWDSSRFRSNWWMEVPAQGHHIEQWLRESATELVLEAAFFQHADSEIADEFASAADWLRQTRS